MSLYIRTDPFNPADLAGLGYESPCRFCIAPTKKTDTEIRRPILDCTIFGIRCRTVAIGAVILAALAYLRKER